MKKSLLRVLLVVLASHSTNLLLAQIGSDPDLYYVVIGAFAKKKNAINFTKEASKTYNAVYEWNPIRSLDYVYIVKTNEKQAAIDEALRMQAETRYKDTWVYHGLLGKDAELAIQNRDLNPVTQQKLTEVPLADLDEMKRSDPQALLEEENAAEPTMAQVPDNPDARNYYFKVMRTDTKAIIEGQVSVIDTDNARKIGTYDANQVVVVMPPAKPDGAASFICEVFGYRKVQRDLSNFGNPIGEDIVLENGAIVVPFELMRLQKGDIATMFHVYFFKDAAVMRPESRYEVNSLVEMMNENPKYKIRIHGHTNGNAPGKITTLNKGNDNFFSLNNTSEGYGSAKKLSLMRAEMMRDYLVSHGIDTKRLQVKAWGGKKPIFDKLHAQAQSNVRVEIEILDN